MLPGQMPMMRKGGPLSILLAFAMLYGFSAAKALIYLADAHRVGELSGLEYYMAFLVMLPWAIVLPFRVARAEGLAIACTGTASFLITLVIRLDAPLDYWVIVLCLAMLNALPLIGLYLISDHAVSRR